MKHFLFSVLLIGTMAAAQAAEPQCGTLPNASANVNGSSVYFTIRGQSAKEIFNGMPESSKLSPKENCYADAIIKVKGGFVCEFNTDKGDPSCAHTCYVEVSAKTGKTAVRKKHEICETDP